MEEVSVGKVNHTINIQQPNVSMHKDLEIRLLISSSEVAILQFEMYSNTLLHWKITMQPNMSALWNISHVWKDNTGSCSVAILINRCCIYWCFGQGGNRYLLSDVNLVRKNCLLWKLIEGFFPCGFPSLKLCFANSVAKDTNLQIKAC